MEWFVLLHYSFTGQQCSNGTVCIRGENRGIIFCFDVVMLENNNYVCVSYVKSWTGYIVDSELTGRFFLWYSSWMFDISTEWNTHWNLCSNWGRLKRLWMLLSFSKAVHHLCTIEFSKIHLHYWGFKQLGLCRLLWHWRIQCNSQCMPVCRSEVFLFWMDYRTRISETGCWS